MDYQMSLPNKGLLDLPFDQYSRQEKVRRIVDESIRHLSHTKKRKLKILDLGGHKGYTSSFFPEDDVHILDVFDEKYDNYHKGDATDTDFAENEFDVVVSFDTFEHIPKILRDKFVLEAFRISKYAFIIAAPFDGPLKEVSRVETEANKLYKKITGKEHPWLAEHNEYGLPEKNELERMLKKMNLHYTSLPTNDLSLWLVSQGLMFNSSTLGHDNKEVVNASHYYNKNLSFMDNPSDDFSYRTIYVGTTNKQIIDSINSNAQQKTNNKSNMATDSVTTYISAINNGYASLIKELRDDRIYLQAREKHLQEMYYKSETARKHLEEENIRIKNTLLKKSARKVSNIIEKVRKK